MYARFRRIALGCFIACIPSVAAGGIIFVDQDAAGANTGTNWHDAFVDLQAALTTAVPGDEIWVAEGIYKPDGGTLDPSISFVLPSGVAIYGGFAGGDSTRSQRDWRAHPTILTGDLLGDDLVIPEPYWWAVARIDNTRHLVRATLTAPTTLDGFGIEHGSAWTDDDGAGLLHDGGTLTLVNCRFQWNSQFDSGGDGDGGAVFSGDFWNGCPDCELTIVNSHFENNHATVAGGALSVTQTRSVKLVNCSFLDHGAGWYADALFLWLTDVELVNCTVATRDGGSWYQDGDVTIENATGSIANSVFYGKYDDEARNLKFYGDRPTIDYSCVRGWSGAYGGVGNFDAAPVFLDLQNGDLRLNCGSPCIDAGDSGALPPDLLDLDGDGDTLEPIPLDAGGTPRRQDDPSTPDTGAGPTPIVDLGAFEFVEPTGPDCNGNGHADLCDLGLGSSLDCNANRVPDECDIAIGASADCNLNTIPDECEPDCNGNLVPDDCDIASGLSRDCDENGAPDECDIAGGVVDCNSNGAIDACDLADGTSADCNLNLIPDECDLASGFSVDCNNNARPDNCDIADGASLDLNLNNIPDECEPNRPYGTVQRWGAPPIVWPKTPIAVAAALTHSVLLNADGTVVAWGGYHCGEADVPAPNRDFIAIAAGGSWEMPDMFGHTLGLKRDGSIVAWGNNDFGQCNVPATNDAYAAIAAGDRHSMGLTSDGSIVVWGTHSGAVPEPNDNFVAMAAGGGHSLGLRADGSVEAWGYNYYGQCDVPAPNRDFVAVAAGWYCSLALKSDGSVVTWGYDLGEIPPPNSDFVAIAAGSGAFLLGLKSDGSIVVWGGCGSSSRCDVLEPNINFVALAAGYDHVIGIRANGTVAAWGDSFELCNVPEPLPDFSQVAAGYQHTLALRYDRSIQAWGKNDFGQCDVPAPNSEFDAVAAGGEHCLGLKTDGSVVAWGANYRFGQCNVPAPNSDFVAVAAGANHSLALRRDGSIVAWGANDCGQCDIPEPNSNFVVIAAGMSHSLGLKVDTSVVAWGCNEMGQCDVPPHNHDFAAIAGGGNHSLAVKADGTIVAWGNNRYGQRIVPTPNTDFVSVAAGANHSLGLRLDGTIVAWGDNSLGQCEVSTPNANFTAIAAAGTSSAALRGDQSLKCEDVLDFRARCRSGRVRAALRLADNAHDGEQVTIRIGETSFTVTVVGDAARAFLPHQSGTISVELVEPAGCADPIILECAEPLEETPDSYGPG